MSRKKITKKENIIKNNYMNNSRKYLEKKLEKSKKEIQHVDKLYSIDMELINMKEENIDLEDLTKFLSTKIFSKHCMIWNSKYKQINGSSEEVSDIIGFTKNTLFGFQIKGKDIQESWKESTVNKRASKVVKKAIEQCNKINTLYKKRAIPKFDTVSDVKINLNDLKFEEIYNICIIHYNLWDKEADKIEIIKSYQIKNKNDYHIFSLEDFKFVILEFDTPKDLKDYLDFRMKVLTSKNLFTSEKDLVATFKFRQDKPDLIETLINKDEKVFITLDGQYEQYISSLGEKFMDRKYKNKVSYEIHDNIIEEFGRCFKEIPGVKNNDIFDIINDLTFYSRIERRLISKSIEEKLLTNSDKPFTLRLAFPGKGNPILLLFKNCIELEGEENFPINILISCYSFIYLNREELSKNIKNFNYTNEMYVLDLRTKQHMMNMQNNNINFSKLTEEELLKYSEEQIAENANIFEVLIGDMSRFWSKTEFEF